MNHGLYAQYEQFLVEPTPDRYRRIRRQLLQSAGARHWRPLLAAQRLIRLGRLEPAERLLESLLPTWLLSPRWHFLWETIAVAQGDEEADDRFQMHACLKAILQTGDGSPARPLLTTYPTDPADVINALGRQVESSQLVQSDHGTLEAVRCDDGHDVWFDCSAYMDGQASPVEPHRWVAGGWPEYDIKGPAADRFGQRASLWN